MVRDGGLQPFQSRCEKVKPSALLINLFIHYLQLGRHPVAGVVACYINTDCEDFTVKFMYGGLHEKNVVATWNCREPSQHCYSQRETKQNLRRDGRSQDLPGTDC